MTDLSLNILLQAQDASASSTMNSVGQAMQNMVSGNIAGAIAGIGAAIVERNG